MELLWGNCLALHLVRETTEIVATVSSSVPLRRQKLRPTEANQFAQGYEKQCGLEAWSPNSRPLFLCGIRGNKVGSCIINVPQLHYVYSYFGLKFYKSSIWFFQKVKNTLKYILKMKVLPIVASRGDQYQPFGTVFLSMWGNLNAKKLKGLGVTYHFWEQTCRQDMAATSTAPGRGRLPFIGRVMSGYRGNEQLGPHR